MISALDSFRAKFLKFSLQLQVLRKLFLNRSERVFLLFIVACSTYLVAALFFPLWVLLIGPIVWGVPHLISSIRYSHIGYEKKQKNTLQAFQFVMWSLVFLYRFCVDILRIPLFWSEQALLLESVVLLISFLVQVRISKSINIKNLFYFILFGALIISTYYFTIETALVLLIGHNYIPLVAWFKSCQTKKDLKTFYIASALYIATSLLIYFGAFSGIYKLIAPSGSIAFLNWDYSEVISPFVNEGYDYEFWFRIVSLYAFSQAIHYFIWLKAIPENYHQTSHPPSFKWSYLKLSSDFGNTSVLLLALLILISSSMWLVYEFQMARLVYFGFASYHGFMEISALPFLKSNRKENSL